MFSYALCHLDIKLTFTSSPNTARNRARARARKMILESPNCPLAVQNAGRVTAAMETALRGVIDPM
jgi:hypothetical protein